MDFNMDFNMDYYNIAEGYYNLDILPFVDSDIIPSANEKIVEPINQKPFICDECGLGYRTNSGLYTHKRKHDPNYINKHSCSLCDYSNDNLHHLYRHIKTHKEPAEIISNNRLSGGLYKESKYAKMYDKKAKGFFCPTCNKKYGSRQSIQVHLKKHDINRIFKFQCNECNFKCDHKGQFNRHISKHK